MSKGFRRCSWSGSSNINKGTHGSISKHTGKLLPFNNLAICLVRESVLISRIFLKMVFIICV